MDNKERIQELNNIKMWLRLGSISYDKAKEMSQPHIDALNKRSAEIAKKHHTIPKKITFTAFMR
jgi:hypothetical protein